MDSPAITLLLVNPSAAARSAIEAAARLAFRYVDLRETSSVEEAIQRPDPNADVMLIVSEPTEADCVLAGNARNADGLPRWPVVTLGTQPLEVADIVPPSEWGAAALARILRTERERHEYACENARLRGDLQTMSRFISHELRTPVSCIYTSCYLLQEVAGNQDEALADSTRIIRDSAAEISRLVDRTSFLLRASLDAGQSAPVEMKRVVTAALQKLADDLQKSGRVIIQPSSWPQVDGVAKWLEVIWSNLLLNAIQHSGGAKTIKLGRSREPTEWIFWVEDDGEGPEPAQRATLFQSFESLHESTGARGLGLPIVRRLSSLQGGRCGYEPAAGGGSRFYFTLPHDASEPAEVVAAPGK
jgi:signal transduction histidine kinase